MPSSSFTTGSGAAEQRPRPPGELPAVAWVGAYAAVLLAFVLARLDTPPYDDAHFFLRLARNALDHGTLSWNVDDGPVHGTSSQGFQAVVLALVAIAGEYSMLAVRAFSVGSLIVGFAALLRLTRALDGGASLAFAFVSAVLLFPALSGMETALSVASVALLVALLYRERAGTEAWYWAPLGVSLVSAIRPDAALIGLGLIAARRTHERKLPWRELGLCAVLFALGLALLSAYYGSALPLPFYAKHRSLTPYGAEFVELSGFSGRQRFSVFALTALPLVVRAAAHRDRKNLELLLVALVFTAYHLTGTLDVMGMHGRFYAPCLPLLLLASARASLGPKLRPRAAAALGAAYWSGVATLVLTGTLPLSSGAGPDLLPASLFVLSSLAGFFLILLSAGSARFPPLLAAAILGAGAATSSLALRPRALRPLANDEYLSLQAARQTVYRGLDSLRRCFGERVHVYHSEIGLPGLRLRAGRVTDFAGLMSTLPFEPGEFERRCVEDRPEAVFLPHRNYGALARDVENSRCLENYLRVVENSSSPLFVRRDLAPRYLDCARSFGDRFVVAH